LSMVKRKEVDQMNTSKYIGYIKKFLKKKKSPETTTKDINK